MTGHPIAIVDDDASVRDSLRVLLDAHGYRALTFADGEQFLQALASETWLSVFLDIRMPGRDGLEILDDLSRMQPELPVIMISAHADVTTAVRAIKNGAIDFFEKPFQAEEVLRLIDKLEANRQKLENRHARAENANSRMSRLTKREREVALKLSDGMANKAIAHELGISVRTVETHRAHVMTKLDIRSLSDLVRIVLASELSNPSN